MVCQVVELVELAKRKAWALTAVGAQGREPDSSLGLPRRLSREVRLRLKGELSVFREGKDECDRKQSESNKTRRSGKLRPGSGW